MDEETDIHRLADALNANGRDLEAELEWLAQLLERRLALYFAEASTSPLLPASETPPPLDASQSPYARFVRQHRLTPAERAVLLLALAPHLRPQLLDVLCTRNETTQRGFAEFGGVQGVSHGGLLPTGESAVFLLAGYGRWHHATVVDVQ